MYTLAEQMEAGKQGEPLSSYMLPTVPLPTQHTLDFICVVVL